LAQAHPFPLSNGFETLDNGLGSFPFDYEAYPPQSHSYDSSTRLRSLVGFGTDSSALALLVLYYM